MLLTFETKHLPTPVSSSDIELFGKFALNYETLIQNQSLSTFVQTWTICTSTRIMLCNTKQALKTWNDRCWHSPNRAKEKFLNKADRLPMVMPFLSAAPLAMQLAYSWLCSWCSLPCGWPCIELYSVLGCTKETIPSCVEYLSQLDATCLFVHSKIWTPFTSRDD